MEVKRFYKLSLYYITTILYLTINFFFFFAKTRSIDGEKFPPSLVNIYMSKWEADLLLSDANPYSFRIRWYSRYKDNLFLVWEGMEIQPSNFVQYNNNNNMNLKLHLHTIVLQYCNFLNVTLSGAEDKKSSVSPLRKSMAMNSSGGVNGHKLQYSSISDLVA